jgi:hypothetical protein
VSELQVGLGYFPRDWQKECHRQRRRFTVLALHRRAGKTELAIMELLDCALKFSQPLGLFFYVAPFLKQAKAIAWARLKARIEPMRQHGMVEINEGELSVTFKHNGAIIRVFGADNPDAMRGVRLDGAVIDEVAQIKPEVWQDVLQPALSDRKGWALFIGTPQGVNLFSELYFRSNALPDWHAARYTVFDTNAIDPDEVSRLKRDMSETSFAREYLCDFAAAGDDQLISLSDVESAAQRQMREDQVSFAAKILGVDPARFGDDRSVIFPRQGLAAGQPIIYRGIDNMTLASRVAAQIEEYKPDAVFIDAGNGGGVIDRLRQLGYDIIEINFGGKPADPRFLNKRAEMWWELREWIRMGGAIPNSVDLKQDLAAPIYWYDSAGRIQLEPKDDIKKRGLPSPDLADALALTFAHPVAKKTPLQQLGFSNTGRRGDWNPYDGVMGHGARDNYHDPYSRNIR